MAKPKPTQVNKSSSMRFRLLSAVFICVGTDPDTEHFVAHESFLTSRSEFFRRAMNGNWKEAETRTINLPDDNAQVFAHYINYVYTGQLPTTSKTSLELKELTEEEFDDHVQDQYEIIFDVFVLSEKLQDITTKNAMMKAALATTRLTRNGTEWRTPSRHTVNAIYNGTPTGSPARRFVTDSWTAVSLSFIFSQSRKLNQEFIKDLCESLEKTRKPVGNVPFRKGIAAYQEEGKEG
ncbi:hypothetical protein ACET3X_000884 [Alternaria dauci]|uniref:BTB domain-containing protein n=1 Tax=Alternaria dauci TaxID=48095 RepID=A0ABR3UVR4_9PLEO